MKKLGILILVLGLAGVPRVWAVDDFTLPGLDQSSTSLHDYLGHKTIVINFWASWCDSCEEEMPQLLNLQKKYSASPDVVFIGIDVGDSPRAAQKFVSKMGYTYRILLDGDKSITKKFGIVGVPQTLVISPAGKIVYQGSRPPADLHFEAIP